MRTADDALHEELTDDELDDVLAVVRQELRQQVQASSSPADVLEAIMASEAGAPQASGSMTWPCNDRLALTRIGTMVSMRDRATEVRDRLARLIHEAWDIAIELDEELGRHRDLAIGRHVGRALSKRRDRRLTVVLGYARDLALQIVSDMAQMRTLDRDLAEAKDDDVVAELVTDIDNRETYEGFRQLDRELASDRQAWVEHQISAARHLAEDLEQARRLSGQREQTRDLDREVAHILALHLDGTLRRARALSNGICRRGAAKLPWSRRQRGRLASARRRAPQGPGQGARGEQASGDTGRRRAMRGECSCWSGSMRLRRAIGRFRMACNRSGVRIPLAPP
jgi:hypothetical protein